MRLATLAFAALVLSAAPAFGGSDPAVDGTLDPSYGAPVALQTVQTNFGDANAGTVGFTNGSELDLLHVTASGTTLYLFFAGNLESNYNKIEIFLDTHDGGQNVLRADNPNVDFDGLNRMSGLRFDAGFEPDYWGSLTGGDNGGTYAMFANWAELLTGGNGEGGYLGSTGAASDGTLSGGDARGVRVTIHNGNTAGVGGGCAAQAPGTVTTGIELAIPLDSLDWTDGHTFKVCAFVNGGSHDFVSNQVIPGLPDGTCNLGDPHAVDFTAHAGDQFATVSRAVPVKPASWGRIKARYR
jgi:hypothetical protein